MRTRGLLIPDASGSLPAFPLPSPTLGITSPSHGACVRGTIEVHTMATDVLPGSVASTTYFVDGGALAPTGVDPGL